MSDSTNITMKDIARDLGVSVATVSRALKDSPRISAEKRGGKIKESMHKKHNFYPNILAESLRKSKVQPMKIIGVIVPQLAHFYFSSIPLWHRRRGFFTWLSTYGCTEQREL